MILEIQVSGQNFDPAVARVHHVQVVAGVEDQGARLDEASLVDSLGPEAQHRGVVFRHVEVQRTVLDGPVEDADLETVRAHGLGGEGDFVGAVLVVLDPGGHLLARLVQHLGRDGVAAQLLHVPVVVDGLHAGHALQVADDGLQRGAAQARERLAGLDASNVLQNSFDMFTEVRVLIASENHVGIFPWLGQLVDGIKFVVQFTNLLCDVSDFDLMLHLLDI